MSSRNRASPRRSERERLPDIQPLTLTVSDEHDGERLDRFLVAEFAGQSRSQLQRFIDEGLVHVDGRAAKANLRIKAGSIVAVALPDLVDAKPAPEDLPLPIVYQDADIIVVDKPAGMVVHPAAGHQSGTLVNALLHHVDDLSGIGGEKRPGIVHRLDRGTSGLMVVAKHDAAHQELARQFQDREVEKEYVALVWGVVVAGRRIEEPIGRDPNNRKRMSNRARRSREAVTRIVRTFEVNPALTLAQIAIHTGRTHQIRVHLSAIGHPIVGDSLYGGVHRRVQADIKAVQKLDRPFLHAAKLAFKHPIDGRRMAFESELPADLKSVLDALIARSHPELVEE
ncbi:MAG: RluA family pseudouridine synthase [Vicinamibacterales bacterium]